MDYNYKKFKGVQSADQIQSTFKYITIKLSSCEKCQLDFVTLILPDDSQVNSSLTKINYNISDIPEKLMVMKE